MSVYERLTAQDFSKISAHNLAAIVQEFARGNLTGAEAQAAVTSLDGVPLTPAEVTELQTLVASFPNQASGQALWLSAIERVWIMAESGLYDEAQTNAATPG